MSVVDRIKGILLSPRTEWPKIASEPATVQSIYTGYVMILAVIGPVMVLLSSLMFPALGVAFGVRSALTMYIMHLVTVAVVALIADLLAPTFGGTKDYVRSLKLVAYSITAVWVSEIALIVPVLGGLVVLVGGIYAIYLFFVGAPLLGRSSSDKAVPFTIVVVLGTIVLMFIVRSIVLGAMYPPLASGSLGLVR